MRIKNFFNKFKRNDDVIDLGNLQKRGILKRYEKKKEIDLTLTSSYPSSSSNSGYDNSDPVSALGFLGNIASASEGTSETNSSSTVAVYGGNSTKQKLKGILRDMKAKIDSNSDKLYKVSERIDLIEKKLERLQRRAGVE